MRDVAEDVVFRAIRTGNVFEEAVERVLHAIKLGVVTAGERLPAERDLASRLGVSRVTVREALRVLEQNGYVESRRGRKGGTFVLTRPTDEPKEPSRLRPELGSEVDDALTLRVVLDVGVAEIAAGRDLSDDERRHLLDRLEESEQAGPGSYRQMDSRLHLAIAEVTGAPSLAAQVADVRMRVNDLLDEIPLLAPNIEHSRQQHRAIVAAILAGDVAGARTATREHLDGTAALLRGFLT
jgi:GntR family transcriptional regulator, transcriptional repressor for pyruvate dehydrogenase complex